MNQTEIEKLIINFENVKSKIKNQSKNRKITLQAATKNVEAEIINFCARKLELRTIGENRAQELIEKYPKLDRELLNIHFIGHLQTNKVKLIIDKVDMIESLDRIELASEIDKQAKKIGIIMPVLIEINIGMEENKIGVLPDEIEEFINKISCYTNISIKGFMTMAPKCTEKSDYLKYFTKAYEISLDNYCKICDNLIENKLSPNSGFVLSMGMSDSFEQAIVSGATMVRIGNALFK